jgi:hypothetical protein
LPKPLAAGERSEAIIKLNDIAHSFPAGHRIRVAISMAYWPIVWPAPEPVTLGIYTGASALELPVRPPRTEDAELRANSTAALWLISMISTSQPAFQPLRPIESAPPIRCRQERRLRPMRCCSGRAGRRKSGQPSNSGRPRTASS